jgi:adenylate cyclase
VRISEINSKIKQLLKPTNLSYLLVGFWAVTGAIATAYIPATETLERQTQSTFFKLRGAIAPPDNIVILAIDEQSLSQGEFYDPKKRPFLEPLRSYPFKRAAYAEVIDKVMAAGAKAVGVDVLFASPSIYGNADDLRLQQTLKRYAGRVVLAAGIERSQTLEANVEKLVTPVGVLDIKSSDTGLVNFEAEANYIQTGLKGNIHRFGSEFLQKTSLAADLRPFADRILLAGQVPFNPPKGNNIFFFGDQSTWLVAGQRIPFFHVIDPGNWNNRVLRGGEYFKDKIVLIGATASSLQDIQDTAFGSMPGIEVHANAIATLMSDRAIAEVLPTPEGRGFLVLLLVAITGLGLRLVKRLDLQFLLSLIASGLWAGVGYISFTYGGWILPIALPAIAIAMTGLSLLATGAIAVQLDKLLLRRTLERYVAAPIVEEIVNQPENYQSLLKGRNIKAAVMFSDIRGFTTISSNMPAEKLVQQLNIYLGLMVDAILESQGTVDKFIGDAVMAEFGSPISQGEKIDAMNAINAALKMRLELHKLRQQWQLEGRFPFFNGIGINYGEVTVGNIGSPRRLEYAVIGDTVNSASRVEGLTKELGTDILITESLYEIVKDEVIVVDCGEHALRGRLGKVKLYGLIGLKSDTSELYDRVQEDLSRHLSILNLVKGGKISLLGSPPKNSL